MKQQPGKQDVRVVAEKGLAASKDFFNQACALATDGAKAITEVADMVWGNSKTINEKAVQNVTQNIEATLTAASEIAAAKSLPQAARLQSEYLQALAARATEQTKGVCRSLGARRPGSIREGSGGCGQALRAADNSWS